jgi:hypothetical protein
MEMLDDAMEQLSQARKQMTCGQCGGAGCEACQGGNGDGMGNGDGEGNGDGMGRGPGQGARPETKTDTAMYDARTRQKVGDGTADVTFVHGNNTPGEATEAINIEYEETRKGSTDPLSGQRIPRKHRRHAREYFDRFREGE